MTFWIPFLAAWFVGLIALGWAMWNAPTKPNSDEETPPCNNDEED